MNNDLLNILSNSNKDIDNQKLMDYLNSARSVARPLVRITGVGFFDYLHGQRGVAPNGIELHPVLDVDFP